MSIMKRGKKKNIIEKSEPPSSISLLLIRIFCFRCSLSDYGTSATGLRAGGSECDWKSIALSICAASQTDPFISFCSQLWFSGSSTLPLARWVRVTPGLLWAPCRAGLLERGLRQVIASWWQCVHKGNLWWAVRSLGDCWPWGLARIPTFPEHQLPR